MDSRGCGNPAVLVGFNDCHVTTLRGSCFGFCNFGGAAESARFGNGQLRVAHLLGNLLIAQL